MKNIAAAVLALSMVILPLASARAQTLTVKVSDSLLGLNQKWAAAYKEKHPAVNIQVTGEGTAITFADLAGKRADLVFGSRAMHYKEAQACAAAFGQRSAETKVAVNGLAVYVNTNNPVQVLTYDQLADIFRGQSKNWKEQEGGQDLAISVYAQVTNSTHGELFNEEVLTGRELSPAAHVLSDEAVLKAVAADPQGIGFGALTLSQNMKPLSIKRAYSSTPVIPTADNISRRIYPISRYVFSYGNPAANSDAIKAYLDWIRSDEGQQVAVDAGFYALPASLRSSQ